MTWFIPLVIQRIACPILDACQWNKSYSRHRFPTWDWISYGILYVCHYRHRRHGKMPMYQDIAPVKNNALSTVLHWHGDILILTKFSSLHGCTGSSNINIAFHIGMIKGPNLKYMIHIQNIGVRWIPCKHAITWPQLVWSCQQTADFGPVMARLWICTPCLLRDYTRNK